MEHPSLQCGWAWWVESEEEGWEPASVAEPAAAWLRAASPMEDNL